MVNKLTLFLGTAVLAVAAAAIWLRAEPGEQGAQSTPNDDEQEHVEARRDTERPPALAGKPDIEKIAPERRVARARPSRWESMRERRAVADQLRKRLAALGYGRKAQATESAPAEPPERMPSPVGSGNQAKEAGGEYIKQVVREQFHPLAGSCYEELLERVPDAAGDVVLDLSIVGNDEIGGVVEEVEVREEGTTLTDEEFLTCVTESMYTTTFAAPSNGNLVTVTYPFSFAP